MQEFEDPFENGYGHVNLEANFMAQILRRYPQRGTPILEKAFDLRLMLSRILSQVNRAAALSPPIRKVLILGVEVPSQPEFMAHLKATLPISRHSVRFGVKSIEARPKFDNLNDLLVEHLKPDVDWLIITDDDIVIPPNFLDVFIFLLEHFEFKLGQPAHKLGSYASYLLTRRNWATLARQTNFVEIGPLVALHRDTFPDLIPFPQVGMGWGLDYHWALLAKAKGWRIGIIDALPIQHLRPVGSGYGSNIALINAKRFLDAHGGLKPAAALTTVAVHRSLGRRCKPNRITSV